MPRFSDYHRTVIGYHGTRRSVAERIVLRQQTFAWQDNPGDWMGRGVYFWEYGPKQAWWWAELRRRHRKWKEPTAVVASMIRLGFCFDLLDPDNARDLKSFHDDLVQARASAGLEPLTNQRRHKYLDKAVFEYAYAAIEQENDKLGEPAGFDTCRGVYVRPGGRGRLWDHSWVEHDASSSSSCGIPIASWGVGSSIPSRRRKMSKKTGPKSVPAAVKIRRAAKASRSMTVQERLQIMLKAGLLTQEQAEKAAKLETNGEPK